MNPLVSSLCLLVGFIGSEDGNPIPAVGSLELQLRGEDPARLARDARSLGDARRGALVFHQPALACATCHVPEKAGGRAPLGPDLSTVGKSVTDVHLIESILDPSKTIEKGYETVTIVTADGRIVTGLLVAEQPDAIVLNEPGLVAKPVTIAKHQIEERRSGGPSLMPAGLVGALGSRQQFLDLVRYVMEIAEYGPARARALKPDPALLAPPLPKYERNLDHAGMIAELGDEHFQRGAAIYERVCANCHGTVDRAGSLPNAPRFATTALKNGADPYRLYRTLTDGFGQMAPQNWMVPRQKYDVIHYVREAYLRRSRATQYASADDAYRQRLPRGTSRGPEPSDIEPWSAMDYGPSLSATYEIGSDGSNFAFKGIAIRLDAGQGGVSRGRAWAVYDHDMLRLAGAWTGQGFIDWNGINFNGRHQVHPRIAGKLHVANPDKPGWADPKNGSLADPRNPDRDGRAHGPLPRGWAHFKGLYHHGDRVILSYTIGTAEILETPGLETDPARPDEPVFTRTLEIGPTAQDLTMRVSSEDIAVDLAKDGQAELLRRDGSIFLHVPGSRSRRVVKVLMSDAGSGTLGEYTRNSPPALPLEPLTHGGQQRWPTALKTETAAGNEEGPFAVDVLAVPAINPWLCQMRLSGFDFLPDVDCAAVCTWDGDVWLVRGIQHHGAGQGLTWQRIACGLFQPLGLKIVAGRIYVACRDQIVCLHDLNGDGEIDFYENFNSDHQVTEHFHEFAMGLQVDGDGNFYYAKAARHGLPAVVPHHGTLLRVNKEGTGTEILATGFRAPNGVCLNKDGTFFLSDQEGFWTPKNRINWVKRRHFYGNMWGYHDVADSSDSAMEQPVVWITNAMDRSPAELVWVESANARWQPLRGSLLSLSYGNGKIFVVPHEMAGGVMQGGVSALPIAALPTGVMRGRFHPVDGELYACGLFAWAGDRTEPGGFYRVRATGKPMYLPIGLRAQHDGLSIQFSGRLDAKHAGNPACYAVKRWSIKRSAEYGSDHYNEQPVEVTGAAVSDDGQSVVLKMRDFRPTPCMEIRYATRAASGELVEGAIHNTIHHVPE